MYTLKDQKKIKLKVPQVRWATPPNVPKLGVSV